MIHEAVTEAIILFLVFVGFTLGLSFWLGRKAKSSAGYFAAHGQIPWFVNGVAFAGDYLSAASFLGICGMIAFYGYDGFLYSIGYLAGWIVALFVVAEPMKRLGKFTFADALDARFDSRGIKLAAGISTLVVSVFYLIPQMVGAGALVQPLLGFDEHWVGVVIVGAVVIMIVVTAGMVSTTWVQFLKGSLLVIFSAILTAMLLERGFSTEPPDPSTHQFQTLTPQGDLSQIYSAETGLSSDAAQHPIIADLQNELQAQYVPADGGWQQAPFLRFRSGDPERISVWRIEPAKNALTETQTVETIDGREYVNGLPKGVGEGTTQLFPVGRVSELPGDQESTGPVGLLSFFTTLQDSEVILWRSQKIENADKSLTTVFYQKPTSGKEILRPGEHPKFAGIRGDDLFGKLNFLSLMLALFCGTASLPHILIRYYTVKDESAARKSTIVGIASIGFFYVLTLYIGLGAMTSGAMDVSDSNLAAPLLAKSMNTWLFAAISAIAFTTVLGTVSGLILASAGAVTHDLLKNLTKAEINDEEQVRLAKISSVVVGAVAIVLGIWFKDMNVSYLVGWAFSIAASANLPSLVMILFWKGVTRQGVIAAIIVGMVSSLGWVLLSSDTYTAVYGLPASEALTPFTQPGIVTIPLGFATLVVVSLLTKGHQNPEKTA